MTPCIDIIFKCEGKMMIGSCTPGGCFLRVPKTDYIELPNYCPYHNKQCYWEPQTEGGRGESY